MKAYALVLEDELDPQVLWIFRPLGSEGAPLLVQVGAMSVGLRDWVVAKGYKLVLLLSPSKLYFLKGVFVATKK